MRGLPAEDWEGRLGQVQDLSTAWIRGAEEGDRECSMAALWQRQEMMEICEWRASAANVVEVEHSGEESTDMRVCEVCQQLRNRREVWVSKDAGASGGAQHLSADIPMHQWEDVALIEPCCADCCAGVVLARAGLSGS